MSIILNITVVYLVVTFLLSSVYQVSDAENDVLEYSITSSTPQANAFDTST